MCSSKECHVVFAVLLKNSLTICSLFIYNAIQFNDAIDVMFIKAHPLGISKLLSSQRTHQHRKKTHSLWTVLVHIYVHTVQIQCGKHFVEWTELNSSVSQVTENCHSANHISRYTVPFPVQRHCWLSVSMRFKYYPTLELSDLTCNIPEFVIQFTLHNSLIDVWVVPKIVRTLGTYA